MKLVLFIVSAMVIFPADSRDFPGKPDKEDLAADQEEYSSRQLVESVPMEERKVEKEIKLRGKGGKKDIKAIKKSLDALKDDNTKLTKDISEMKKSLDSLKDNNTKLTQENSEMKNSLNSIKAGNIKLTQANSVMNTKLQAILNRIGGARIGGQYLTFSTEKVTWDIAKSRCRSLNARLAVLANPQAFYAYANTNFRGYVFWLGASDISREGAWTWINGKSLGSFPWLSGQPSNSGDGEDCLEWGYGNNYNDRSCIDTVGYVCEHGYN